MSDERIIQGVNNRWGKDQQSPIDYHLPDGLVARRLSFFQDNNLVYFIDYVIDGETRYVLYLEVAEKYRRGRWMEYAKLVNIEAINNDHSDFEFVKAKRVVFLRVSPWLAEKMPGIMTMMDEMNVRDRMMRDALYIEGSFNMHSEHPE